MKTQLLICSLFVICGVIPIPSIDAHDVLYAATTFTRIEDETFDKYHMQTGENLTIQGRITSNVEKDIRGWMSIFSESSNANNRWEIMARDPPETVFDVMGGSSVDYSITVKALTPGTYHIHSQFSIDKIGPYLGPGQTIVVQGEPIITPVQFTNIAYQLTPIAIGSMIVIAIAYYFWSNRK